MIIKNKKAQFNYHILDTMKVGVVLVGSEIKPLLKGAASIAESYIYINNNELFIKNMHIKNQYTNHYTHDEFRDRKLLMEKWRIKKWKDQLERERLTIVPIKIYLDGRYIKMDIGLAKGKKLYDKKEDIRKRDMDRDQRYN